MKQEILKFSASSKTNAKTRNVEFLSSRQKIFKKKIFKGVKDNTTLQLNSVTSMFVDTSKTIIVNSIISGIFEKIPMTQDERQESTKKTP